MKKYLIKLAALSVVSAIGVCALAACGETEKAPTDGNASATENVTEPATDSAE